MIIRPRKERRDENINQFESGVAEKASSLLENFRWLHDWRRRGERRMGISTLEAE